MKCKKVFVKVIIHYEGDSPYEITIERLNPSNRQIDEVKGYVGSILDDEITRLGGLKD